MSRERKRVINSRLSRRHLISIQCSCSLLLPKLPFDLVACMFPLFSDNLSRISCIPQFTAAASSLILGAHHRTGSPTSVQETINVTKIISHSGFNFLGSGFKDVRHDVALLKLEKPITLSDKVNTVCLAKGQRDKISSGKNCYITGKADCCYKKFTRYLHFFSFLHFSIFQINI